MEKDKRNDNTAGESLWLGVEEIITLMDAFGRNGLGTLKLKNGDQQVTLKARENQITVSAAAPVPEVQAVTAPGGEADAASGEAPPHGTVTSPIVGTFYAAPAPDKDPFVQVGKKVKKGDVLFIIESMKLMNEVLSERDGTVTQILVENAQAVEFGQPILRIE